MGPFTVVVEDAQDLGGSLVSSHAVGGHRVESGRSCDLAWSAMAVHHADDEVATLGRIRELLRPQGLLCLLERADPTSVRLEDNLGRPGIWDRLDEARIEWFERARPTLPGALNAGSYPGMLASRDST